MYERFSKTTYQKLLQVQIGTGKGGKNDVLLRAHVNQ